MADARNPTLALIDRLYDRRGTCADGFPSAYGDPLCREAADALLVFKAENEQLREALRDWRPIENAPRDWSWFLAWGEDAGHCVLRLGPNPIWSEEPEVTHWRPLPSAPALAEQEGKPCDCGSVEFGAGAHWPSGRFGKVTCSSCGSEQEGK